MLPLHHPDLVLLHSPLPDKTAQVFIHKAKAICAAVRIIVISDRPEMTGYVMAQRKGADGYISCRLLRTELPLVLGRYHELAPQWGHRFSPWKEHYGMA
jgi:DNA-binding response OmpR family regulator